MSLKLSGNYHLAYSKELIAKRVTALGASISEWVKQHSTPDDQILCLCVLRGGSLFFSDLIREISASVEIGFCRTWSYSVENHQVADGMVRVSVEDVAAQGRRVLVVDDICDSGKTLSKLKNVFLELGALEVRTAVLIHRMIDDQIFTPTWSAFEYHGNEWFVGYGMADREMYFNAPEVYSILPKQSG